MRGSALVLVIAATTLSGCASSLKIYHNGQEVRGIPFRATVLVEVERVTTYELVTADASLAIHCTPDSVVTLELLPVGDEYLVTIDPSDFGKAEFSLELYASGALKKVTLGSDPGTASAVEAGSELASAVLPYLAPVRTDETAAMAADPTARQLKEKHCRATRTDVVRVRRRTVD